jgi:hypothetical protein
MVNPPEADFILRGRKPLSYLTSQDSDWTLRIWVSSGQVSTLFSCVSRKGLDGQGQPESTPDTVGSRGERPEDAGKLPPTSLCLSLL